MRIIGSQDEAEKIHDWVRHCEAIQGKPRVVRLKSAPRGWRYISRGEYRSAWLSPSGVVYKVNHRRETYWDQSAAEAANLRSAWFQKPPAGCRIVRFGTYSVKGEVIVAMEYVDGELVDALSEAQVNTDPYYARMRRMEDLFKLSDLHGDNAMVDGNGNLVVIDWGC